MGKRGCNGDGRINYILEQVMNFLEISTTQRDKIEVMLVNELYLTS